MMKRIFPLFPEGTRNPMRRQIRSTLFECGADDVLQAGIWPELVDRLANGIEETLSQITLLEMIVTD